MIGNRADPAALEKFKRWLHNGGEAQCPACGSEKVVLLAGRWACEACEEKGTFTLTMSIGAREKPGMENWFDPGSVQAKFGTELRTQLPCPDCGDDGLYYQFDFDGDGVFAGVLILHSYCPSCLWNRVVWASDSTLIGKGSKG